MNSLKPRVKFYELTLAGSSVDGGESGGSGIEHSGYVDIVPFFLCERVGAI